MFSQGAFLWSFWLVHTVVSAALWKGCTSTTSRTSTSTRERSLLWWEQCVSVWMQQRHSQDLTSYLSTSSLYRHEFWYKQHFRFFEVFEWSVWFLHQNVIQALIKMSSLTKQGTTKFLHSTFLTHPGFQHFQSGKNCRVSAECRLHARGPFTKNIICLRAGTWITAADNSGVFIL